MADESDRPPFHTLEPARSLTGAVIEQLIEQITNGHLAPNQRLPTEQEMIAAFGVSRTVVREAISALKAEGLVDTRQGAGVFVTKDPRRPFRIDSDRVRCVRDVLQLMELRTSVEVEAAGFAAVRRTDAQLRAIDTALRDFERAVQAGDDAVEPDYVFHCAIGAATDNDYFVSFLRYLGSFIIPRRSIHVGHSDVAERRAYLEGVLVEHTAIADAIRSGDVSGARGAMRLHLEHGRDRYRTLDPDLSVG